MRSGPTWPEPGEPRRRPLARLAGFGLATALATFVAAPLAAADDTTSTAPTDTSSDPATPSGGATPTDSPSTPSGTPTTSPADPSSPATGPSAPAGSGSQHGPAGRPAARPATKQSSAPSGSTKQADIIEPQFGMQKIRVGIQLKDGSFFAPGTSLANSTIQAVETGPNAPSGAPAECVTDSTGACAFDTPLGTYNAAPGDTVVFTQITPPDGPGVLTDVPQTVGPCVLPVEVITVANASADSAPATNQDEEFPTCSVLDTLFSQGGAQADTVTRDPVFGVTVTFDDPPAPPDAVDDSATVHSGHSVDVAVLANDVLWGAPTTITAVSHPAHGTATVVGDEVRYAPEGDYGGPDSFTYTITTPNGTDTATVHMTVLAPPIAVDDSATTTSGDPGPTVVVDVLANDHANGGSPLTITSATTPGHGTIAFSGATSIAYTPRGNFVGVDTFTYTISTPNGSDTATVRVTVNAAAVVGLANTGVPAQQLETTAALLLLAGAGVTAAGRRRRGPGRAH